MALEQKVNANGLTQTTATGSDIKELLGVFRESSRADVESRADTIREAGSVKMRGRNGQVREVDGVIAEKRRRRGWDLADGARPCVVMPANFNPDPKEVAAAREAARKRRR